MKRLAPALLLASLVVPVTARAQTAQLDPFQFKWNFAFGSDGVARPLVAGSGNHWVRLNTYTGRDSLSYLGYLNLAPDNLSGDFDVIANGPDAGNAPFSYSLELRTAYQGVKSFDGYLDNFSSPAVPGDDVVYTKDMTQLCSLRVDIHHACDDPNYLRLYAGPSTLQGGEDTSSAAQADITQSQGFVRSGSPGAWVTSGELVVPASSSASFYGYINFVNGVVLSYSGNYATPTTGACQAVASIDLTGQSCSPPTHDRQTSTINGNIQITKPDAASCEYGSLSGCASISSAQMRATGTFDVPQTDYGLWVSGADSYDVKPDGSINYSIGVWAGMTSFAQYYWDRNYSLLNLGWADGRHEQLQPPFILGTPGWSPAADTSTPVDGIFPNANIIVHRTSAATANYFNDGAVLDGRFQMNGCVANPNLNPDPNSSWFQIRGVEDTFATFTPVNPYGSMWESPYIFTGTHGGRALAWLDPGTTADGRWQILATPGNWHDDLINHAFLRTATTSATDYLNETLQYQPTTQRTYTLSHTSSTDSGVRTVGFSKLNVRMAVINGPSAASRLRPFSAPYGSFSGQGTAAGALYSTNNLTAYGPSDALTTQILHIVAPAGSIITSSNLRASVPPNPDGSGTAQDTQFPNVGPITMPPVGANGACSVVCVDSADPTKQYPDDEQDPTSVTFDPVPPPQHHAGAYNISGSAIDSAPIGTAIANGQPGTITFTKQGNDYVSNFNVPIALVCGPNTLTVIIADRCGGTVTKTVNIQGTNTAPTYALSDLTLVANHPYVLQIGTGASDADSDKLTFAANTLPAGAVLDATKGTVTWTPTNAQQGANPVSLSAVDVCTNVPATATWTVLANHPPVLDPLGPLTVAETHTLTGATLTGSDPDIPNPGDTLTFSITSFTFNGSAGSGPMPAGMTLNAATGVISWQPGYRTWGTYVLHARVTDAGGLHDDKDVIINVTKTTVAPLLTVPTPNGVENQPLSFSVIASDPNGDAFTLSAANLPPGASFNGGTATFSWRPDYTQAGPWTVTVTAAKDGGFSTSQDVHITVANVNRPPVLPAVASQTVQEKTLLSFAVGDADGGKIDPDIPLTRQNPSGMDTLTYTSGTLPRGATFNGTTRTFSWTPDYGQWGDYTASFTVTDDSGLSSTQIAHLHVIYTNLPPNVVSDDVEHTSEGTNLHFFTGVTDPRGTPLTCSMLGLPDGASYDPSTLLFSWTPTYDQSTPNPSNLVVITRCCNAPPSPEVQPLCTDIHTTIIVDNVDRPPVMDPIPLLIVTETDTLTYTATAIDPDGDPLTWSADLLPRGATFDAASHTLTWTPDYTQAGDYEALISVSDGTYRDRRPARIHVLNLNRAPVIAAQATVQTKVGLPTHVSPSVSDPDADFTTCHVNGLPEGASYMDAPRGIDWRPIAGQEGAHTLTLVCCDTPSYPESSSLCSSGPIEIDVAAADANLPPVIQPGGPYTIKEGQKFTFPIVTSDPENDPVVSRMTDLPGGAVFDAIGSAFKWTPDYGQAGDYTVTAYATDNKHAEVSQAFVIHVIKADFERAGGGIATGCSTDPQSTNTAWVGVLALLVMWPRRRMALVKARASRAVKAGAQGLRVPLARIRVVHLALTMGSLVLLHGCFAGVSVATLHGNATFVGASDHSGITLTLAGPSTQVIVTDATGKWSSNGLLPGTYVIAAKAGDTREREVVVTAVAVGGANNTAPDIVFTGIGSISGKVTRGASTGNAGIAVTVPGTNALAIAADDGSFTLAAVPAGTHHVMAAAQGLGAATSAELTVARGQTATAPDMTLQRTVGGTGRIRGHLVLTGASAPAGQPVFLDGPTPSATVTDASGLYDFQGLLAGAYTIEAVVPSSLPAGQSLEVTIANGDDKQNQDLTFTATGAVSGKATFADASATNAGIRISARG
ncbi:MAG: putative Ig domain-containing protein [Deltaproteobacteria bacterium]|nr:putative Ig domain-containing protein [Deltaproteobacteria bacterium]